MNRWIKKMNEWMNEWMNEFGFMSLMCAYRLNWMNKLTLPYLSDTEATHNTESSRVSGD